MTTDTLSVSWQARNRYLLLLTTIVLFILLPPFVKDLPLLKYIIYFLVSLLIITCVMILFNRSHHPRYGLVVAAISLLFIWLTTTRGWGGTYSAIGRSVILLAFYGLTFIRIIRDITGIKKVNAQVIIGAMAAYFLLGLIGAILFQITELLYPGSFTNPSDFDTVYRWVYYSFVTLSTLGYGDITPASPQGQAIAIFVSVGGQLFLAVLMAMLVGKFLQDKTN